jgi:hypothetical protein
MREETTAQSHKNFVSLLDVNLRKAHIPFIMTWNLTTVIEGVISYLVYLSEIPNSTKELSISVIHLEFKRIKL